MQRDRDEVDGVRIYKAEDKYLDSKLICPKDCRNYLCDKNCKLNDELIKVCKR